MNKNKPVLTLNMNDKIYLAVSKNLTDALSFVFTLACNKNENSNKYEMVANSQIHTFKSKEAASIYHDTIEQIVAINESNPAYEMLFKFNEQQTENFLQNVK